MGIVSFELLGNMVPCYLDHKTKTFHDLWDFLKQPESTDKFPENTILALIDAGALYIKITSRSTPPQDWLKAIKNAILFRAKSNNIQPLWTCLRIPVQLEDLAPESRVGSSIPTLPHSSRANVCSFGQATQFHGTLKRSKAPLSTIYLFLQKPGKVILKIIFILYESIMEDTKWKRMETQNWNLWICSWQLCMLVM